MDGEKNSEALTEDLAEKIDASEEEIEDLTTAAEVSEALGSPLCHCRSIPWVPPWAPHALCSHVASCGALAHTPCHSHSR